MEVILIGARSLAALAGGAGDGGADGLILSSIKPGSIFRKMGLRNGDILTGVDGEKIESVDNALAFYEKLKLSSHIALQLKRRGQLKTIEYNIE